MARPILLLAVLAYLALAVDSWDRQLQAMASAGTGQQQPQQAQTQDPEDNRNKLAIIYLFTNVRSDAGRLTNLRASLTLCALNVFPTTPTTVYVFTLEVHVEELKSVLANLLQQHSNIFVMPVTKDSWKLHPMAENGMKWHELQYGVSYRIMGDWRLSYMPSFARDMGHRYLMQLDDDSYILGPVGYNLVQDFDTKGYVIGARAQLKDDPPVVTWGLPELTRYFLVTEKVKPAVLFRHCSPPNLSGLHSKFDFGALATSTDAQEVDNLRALNESAGGWEGGPILYGNCVMWSIDWWFTPQVNRFVQLCLVSGGSTAYRWIDQDVISMTRLVFAPDDKFTLFNFTYSHTKDPKVPSDVLARYNHV